jgi:hypothetical protein
MKNPDVVVVRAFLQGLQYRTRKKKYKKEREGKRANTKTLGGRGICIPRSRACT